jgi:hypothetical protein
MTKISQLTNIGSALAADDEFVVRDVSDISTPNKKVTSSGIIDYIISQGGVSGFTQIAAGVGPLARVRTISSGTTGTILFETANGGSIAERARCDPAGRFLAGLTTANTSGAKLQTSDGLTFPATQVASADPNTLDDYEEGLWTPTVEGTSTAGTATYTLRTGKYTKVGNLVYISIELTWSSGTGTGSLKLTGLPFAPTNFGSLALAYADGLALTAGTYCTLHVHTNNNIFLVQNVVGGGVVTNVAYDAAVTQFYASGSYLVT